MLAIARDNGTEAKGALDTATDVLRAGALLVVYPEAPAHVTDMCIVATPARHVLP
jgi:hypothetical protein